MEAANFGLWEHVPSLDPPLVQGQIPGRGLGDLRPPEAENLAINLQQTFRDFFTINVNLSNELID